MEPQPKALPAAAPALPTPSPKPAPKRRRAPDSVLEDLAEAFPDLPEVFDKHDIGRALGYEPARATLFRALLAFSKEGLIKPESLSLGGTTTRYRKLAPEA